MSAMAGGGQQQLNAQQRPTSGTLCPVGHVRMMNPLLVALAGRKEPEKTIPARSLPRVKCVIWDLDNTIWNGVLLEDDQVEIRDQAVRIIMELDAPTRSGPSPKRCALLVLAEMRGGRGLPRISARCGLDLHQLPDRRHVVR